MRHVVAAFSRPHPLESRQQLMAPGNCSELMRQMSAERGNSPLLKAKPPCEGHHQSRRSHEV